MSETNVFQLAQPGTFADSLTDVLREGARTLLAQAVEAEVADFLARHADRTTADGRRRIVRHGHLPERLIMTGIGPVTVRQPRVRDRAGDAGERIRFSPNILPRYARRTKSLGVLIPILYLKGDSTGDTCVSWPLQLPAMFGPGGVGFFFGVPAGEGGFAGGAEVGGGGEVARLRAQSLLPWRELAQRRRGGMPWS